MVVKYFEHKEIDEKGWSECCHTRASSGSRRPGITTKEIVGDRGDCQSLWRDPVRRPDDDERKKMIAAAVETAVKTVKAVMKTVVNTVMKTAMEQISVERIMNTVKKTIIKTVSKFQTAEIDSNVRKRRVTRHSQAEIPYFQAAESMKSPGSW